MLSVLIITHLACLSHLKEIDHPESPSRLTAVIESIRCIKHVEWQDATLAQEEVLSLAHTKQHISKTLEFVGAWDDDTVADVHSKMAMLYAAGAVIQAIDAVMSNRFKRVFCAIRPPGHHASTDQAMGFCFLNNVAIGALYAKKNYGLERIAIVDFDVHHGNGTEEILSKHEGFLYLSTHESPLYPGTGLVSNEGKSLNIPMKSRSGSRMFRDMYETKIIPELINYRPQLILISAGFDAHRSDPLSSVNLSAEDFRWVTEKIAGVADATCEGKIVSTLEGGYNIDALKMSVKAHVEALGG